MLFLKHLVLVFVVQVVFRCYFTNFPEFILQISAMLQVSIPTTVTSDSPHIDCPVCPFKAYSPFQLRRHAILSHLSVFESVYWSSQIIPRFTCEIFTCAYCGAAASESNRIKDHLHRAHANMSSTNTQCAILAQHIELGHHLDDGLASDSDEDLPDRRPFLTPNRTTSSSEDVSAFAEPAETGLRDPINTTVNTAGHKNWSPTIVQATPSANPSNSHMSSPDSSTKRAPGLTDRAPLARPPVRRTGQDWSKLIARSEKKFICLLCRRYIYSGRTEVVFHSVTRHLLVNEIESDLSHYGRLTDTLKRQIGQNFADGMRIRSGVHYKDAKRVEAALFRSIELHIRFRPTDQTEASGDITRYYSCSGCGATFTEPQVAYAHVNDELRAFLPEFMRARSCPWSLSTREEWVWCVPDLPLEPLPPKTPRSSFGSDVGGGTTLVLGDRIHKPEAQQPVPTQSWASSVTLSSPVTSDTAAAVEVVKSLVAAAGLLQSATLPAADKMSLSVPTLTSPIKMETNGSSEDFSAQP
ncbi:hypothetical protein CRM22_010507 [Opisthorchis felineus]|uniref:C2H2-type domain-containing protein n=1 Tax=Opisthorchis felineus TaxID=147828 RepID=A0A4S2L3E6_OPIFE|nr:hypothetical protein CRM22_010507 [Opisthorchis felineus]